MVTDSLTNENSAGFLLNAQNKESQRTRRYTVLVDISPVAVRAAGLLGISGQKTVRTSNISKIGNLFLAKISGAHAPNIV